MKRRLTAEEERDEPQLKQFTLTDQPIKFHPGFNSKRPGFMPAERKRLFGIGLKDQQLRLPKEFRKQLPIERLRMRISGKKVEEVEQLKEQPIEEKRLSKTAMELLDYSRRRSVSPASTTEENRREKKPQVAFTPNKMFLIPISQKKVWHCTTCLSENDDKLTQCACCEADREGDKKIQAESSKLSPPSQQIQKPVPVASQAPQKPLAGMFLIPQPPKNVWHCDTCLSENKFELEQCACCEAPKPGCQAKTEVKSDNQSQSKITSSGFVFGGNQSFATPTSNIFTFPPQVQTNQSSGGFKPSDATGGFKASDASGGFKPSVSSSSLQAQKAPPVVVTSLQETEESQKPAGYEFTVDTLETPIQMTLTLDSLQIYTFV